jgi:hypothetical protein
MIRYLRNAEIDRTRWDECLRNSTFRRIYAYSWYLDIVCPDWDALVADDYRIIMPLTHNSRYGIRYLFQPFFAQQLGPFSNGTIDLKEFSDFFRMMTDAFRFAEIQVNSGVDFVPAGWKVRLRVNNELPLGKEYQAIYEGYARNTKRNLKKASASGLTAGPAPSPETLVSLFRNNFGKKEGKLKTVHYERMNNLIKILMSRGMAITEGIYTRNGTLQAAACLVKDELRHYFLFAASAEEARESGAMFMLIDRYIQAHAGSGGLLDFEGGNEPSLGRFYKGFGAIPVTYSALSYNALPKPVKWIFSLRRKLTVG